MKNIINVTSNAWKKMNSIILKSNNKYGFLFGITSGGCNGFNFNFNLMDTKNININSLFYLKIDIFNMTY